MKDKRVGFFKYEDEEGELERKDLKEEETSFTSVFTTIK